jgi:hypothetical protein
MLKSMKRYLVWPVLLSICLSFTNPLWSQNPKIIEKAERWRIGSAMRLRLQGGKTIDGRLSDRSDEGLSLQVAEKGVLTQKVIAYGDIKAIERTHSRDADKATDKLAEIGMATLGTVGLVLLIALGSR